MELNKIELLTDQVLLGSISPFADKIDAMFTICVGLKSLANDVNL